MSTIYEKPNSPVIRYARTDSTVHREYYLDDYADEATAFAALAAEAPSYATVDGYILGSVEYSLDQVDGINKFTGTVDYKHKSRDRTDEEELESDGDERISFDFSGQSVIRTHVVEGGSQQKFGPDSKDVGDLINVLDDDAQTVQGAEVFTPTGTFSVTVLIANATVTNAWLKARFTQIGTTNAATFRSLAAGDVLLVGISGQKRDSASWEITYKFQISISETLSTVADITVSTTKEGFQYLWVMTQAQEQNQKLVPKALGVYIADVYTKSDFSQLGIAT